jgi:hypothetical protein
MTLSFTLVLVVLGGGLCVFLAGVCVGMTIESRLRDRWLRRLGGTTEEDETWWLP